MEPGLLLGAQSTGGQYSVVIDGVTYRALQVDSQGRLVTAGAAGVSVLDRSPATAGPVNTAVETDLYAFTIPANTVVHGAMVRLTMWGTCLNNSAATRTVILRVRVPSGVAVGDTSGAFGFSSALRPWWCQVTLGRDDAVGGKVGGMVWMATAAAGGSGGNMEWGIFLGNKTDDVGSPMRAIPAWNPAIANLFQVTAQLSVANANLSMRKEFAILELL